MKEQETNNKPGTQKEQITGTGKNPLPRSFRFSLYPECTTRTGMARAGILETPHGTVETPAFMSVATQGSVKALGPSDLQDIGAQIILANTYHLYLRPGIGVIKEFGDLHQFMAWNGPILTDSGGFQGYSLAHLRKLNENGIIFKSHLDGSLHEFTPEAVVRYQQVFGADIIMPLDVCEPSSANKIAVEKSLERTLRWATRSIETHKRDDQALFGIVQGGMFPDLRQRSAEMTIELGFSGYAIGGLSVGETKSQMHDIVKLTTPLLPTDMPRYLMGVGSPEDLVECVAQGIDMFDCVLPTRIARNGALFTENGRINIDTASFRSDNNPIDDKCDCYTCQTFPAAYIHHLFRAKELLAYRLATIHNLRFTIRLMEHIRQSIIEGTFESLRQSFHERFRPPDEQTRRAQKLKWLKAVGRGSLD